jgi:hypothetical protein
MCASTHIASTKKNPICNEWGHFFNAPTPSTPSPPASPQQQHQCGRNAGGGIGEFGRVVQRRTWTTPNQPLSTPPDHLRAAHILIAFLAAAAETEQQDVDNRSIGRNYCIRTAADGPYVAAGIIACNHIIVVDTSCT